tara:strand:+ start:7942 stop:8280 length:339 start_codon:yes stop_codon:yes gene_type:complete
MNDIFPKKGVSGIGSDLSRALVAAKLAGGVMVIDRNFRVVMIDRKAAEFCRVSSGQSQGKRFYALFPSLMGSASRESCTMFSAPPAPSAGHAQQTINCSINLLTLLAESAQR